MYLYDLNSKDYLFNFFIIRVLFEKGLLHTLFVAEFIDLFKIKDHKHFIKPGGFLSNRVDLTSLASQMSGW